MLNLVAYMTPKGGNMKYPFKVFQWKNGEDVYWIAESTALNGCAAQADSIEAACEELAICEDEWLETAKEMGMEIPKIIPEENTKYSGKFTVRVAPYVHRQAAENAKANGISLAQYVSDALVAHNQLISFENIDKT